MFPGGGRGRRRKLMMKSPPVPVSPRSSATEVHSFNDLGGPLPDEDDLDPDASSQTDLFLPVPEVVHDRSSDTETVIKSEPIDPIEISASESIPAMPRRLGDHSYSYMDHVDSATDQHRNLSDPIEEEPLSRTSGRKYAWNEECTGYFGCDVDRRRIDVVVPLRKKLAPPIANRLIIPVIRVARSVLTERNVIHNAATETDVIHNDHERDISSGGEHLGCILCLYFSCFCVC